MRAVIKPRNVVLLWALLVVGGLKKHAAGLAKLATMQDNVCLICCKVGACTLLC